MCPYYIHYIVRVFPRRSHSAASQAQLIGAALYSEREQTTKVSISSSITFPPEIPLMLCYKVKGNKISILPPPLSLLCLVTLTLIVCLPRSCNVTYVEKKKTKLQILI